MEYYTDAEGRLHAIENKSFEAFLPVGCVPVEKATVEEMLKPSVEQVTVLAAEQRYIADAEAARKYAKLKALTTMTPVQVQDWVSKNVTNLAQAQDAISTLAIAVSILARRI